MIIALTTGWPDELTTTPDMPPEVPPIASDAVAEARKNANTRAIAVEKRRIYAIRTCQYFGSIALPFAQR